jgi:DNA-binding NtrC family response regulator
MNVAWIGPGPSSTLRQRLAAKGLSVGARDALARVIRSAELPQVESGLPWIWVSDRAVSPALALQATVAGAYDVIALDGRGAIERLARRLEELCATESTPLSSPGLVAHSEAARSVLTRVWRAARTSQPVLITGETGTGKEVTARLLHAWSARAKGPFVPINCAAIPNELMEGELFGYAKGAFSGAVARFDGRLISAEGGTVFLDEIDDTPFPTQVKLLRVLEDRVVTRLGETEPHQVNFRLLAATNRDLKPLIASGAFGADFYERLAIVSIQLPPLRERLEDLPHFARHFLERFYADEPAARAARVTEITPEAHEALRAYPWPGNIRELRNVIFEALVYKRGGSELLASDLPRRVLRRGEPGRDGLADAASITQRIERGEFNLRGEIEALERVALMAALARAGGNAAKAAALLGEVGRGSSSDPGGTVRAMMRRLGVGRRSRR